MKRAGEVIELKPRDYQLLEYMMRYAGQPVTRAMLFEAVWNYHFNAQTNARRSCVRFIAARASNLTQRRDMALV